MLLTPDEQKAISGKSVISESNPYFQARVVCWLVENQ